MKFFYKGQLIWYANFFIPALASKKSLNQTTLLYDYVNYPLIGDIKCLYFFDLTSFKRLGQKSKVVSFGFWFKWEQENLLSKLTDLYSMLKTDYFTSVALIQKRLPQQNSVHKI